jgi:hypothetical protein
LHKRTHRSGELIPRIERQAHERAAALARRVPWQVLLAARNQYLGWQEFYCWTRSIIESEECIPGWLAAKLDEMCPGFLRTEEQYLAKHPKEAALAAVRLGRWIDEHIFSFAAEGGWLPAITFYAVREPRYQRTSAYWSESIKQWRKEKPAEYPSFEQWLTHAARCDDTAHLVPEIRKEQECFKLVEPERLAAAVSNYIDWEALAYWARPALEHKPPVLDEVARELHARCPGFAEFNAIERSTDEQWSQAWNRLIRWVGGHFFKDAKATGWYEAIIISARNHPRAIRTMEYANHCDEVWRGELPVPFPSFESWRRDADRYVELDAP